MPIYKKVNKNFFKKWTPNMAYVLGFLFADGNIIKNRKGGYYIAFHTKDKDILESIKLSMCSEHKISKRISDTGCMYRMQIGSKSMFSDLIFLGLIPNKSKRMELPKIPNSFHKHFIRGYFDGDGNVWFGYVNKSRKKPTLTIQVAFTSGCLNFLKELLILIRYLGIKGGSIYNPKNKNFGRLAFSTLDALKLHKIMYNTPSRLYLKRKKVVFEKFIKKYAAVV